MTFFPAVSVASSFLLFFTGLLPFMSMDFDVYSCPKYTVEMKNPRRETPIKLNACVKFIAKCCFSCFECVNFLLIKHMQARGIPVIQWVLNDPIDFKEAINNKVNGIMTDSPTALIKYLEDKDKYLQV
eukprot:CAMPEP_0114580108 /NCGR_PEP_ID=MMETSP0125-20121206/4443_1 /TAXON_ID=485358 ORGANISM="Aristerostoma sp., Strain ATCC 50986" /NCGR_SAMPLE_ID=MMETSP0125 /ASSEMBLY_ACC=CAM_ASM_000245 /LENGTH=127 /DNA_ID=CAMNT_0001771439 /DNA_START=575 /DNA_END=958 /DNA_ORIENTATION=-